MSRSFRLGLVLLLVPGRAFAQQQNLGHKIPGASGIGAGDQIPPGLYFVEGFASYGANAVYDRFGNRVPGNFALAVEAARLGVVACVRLDPIATYVGMSVGVPVASVTGALETTDLRASVDQFGFSDVYIEPVRAGWRLPRVDIVADFGVYVPTGEFEPGGLGSVGSGQFSRELSAGGTVYFDDGRRWKLSALSSYVSSLTKRDIDIRRGDLVLIQGGLGAGIHEDVTVGVAGYVLWQVSDDSGADLPAILRTGRDRAYGLGPEVDFTLRSIRSQVTLRYEHDLAAASRPLGQIFVFGYTYSAWSP
jgi:hypothetical protein